MIGINSLGTEKILLVDDEKDILDLLETTLIKEGFKEIYKSLSGYEGIELCKKINPDIIVLDIMLPDIDGFQVCQSLREITLCPILFLSAKNDDIDKLLGLSLGGDDYITKPFSPKEVAYRIKAQLRRKAYLNTIENNIIEFGQISINEGKKEVSKNGQVLSLTAKEYQLLLYLAKYPNHILSKKTLYEAIWEEPYFGDDNTIMVHIRKIREKVEDIPSSPKYLLTIKGLGYKLNTKEV
ncbi:response regulator transcription factor [Tissierella carlieri]|uniref:response regulator transcription factor n=1 Tax=Tissierella carlieri TaxID=689904 RepID=UPI001FE796B7|nr:response regulator transcription factor [Tissierella carlieri]MDU5081669.1 response regulator transcription factor [Bacillota bacterium]